MKNIIISFLGILLCLSSFAQISIDQPNPIDNDQEELWETDKAAINTSSNHDWQLVKEEFEKLQSDNTFGFETRTKYIYDPVLSERKLVILVEKRKNGSWIGHQRVRKEYDGNLVTTINEFHDGSEWIKQNGSTVAYNGDLIRYNESYNFDGDVKNYTSRFEYTYTVDRQIESLIQQIYITPYGWRNLQRVENTYNDEKKLQEQIQMSWRSGRWNAEWKDSYIYNSENQPNRITKSHFTVSDGWMDIMRNEYTYDPSGQNAVTLVRQNNENGTWVNSYKYNFTYFDRNLTKQITEIWQDDRWVNRLKFTYIRATEHGNLVATLQENWNETMSDWFYNLVTTYEYDEYQNLSVQNVHKWENGFSTLLNRTRYTYSEIAKRTSILNVKTIPINVFPNPAVHSIKINFPTDAIAKNAVLSCYRIDGTLVKQVQNINDAIAVIDVQDLTSGLYVLHIVNEEGQIFTSRFVKQ